MRDPCLLPAGTLIPSAFGVSEVLPSVDFETYSEAGYTISPEGKVKGMGSTGKGGLGVVGTPNYVSHPTADILCLYYDLKDGKGRRLWVPGFPAPMDLLLYVINGGIIEAWNVTFEFYAWNVIGVRKYGWPPLPLTQCRCAMAKSRRFSLPGKLNLAAKVLGTPQKDKEGTRLINKLTRPVSATKKRTQPRWTPITAWDDYCKLYDYCGQDIVAEDHASARIPDLTLYEFEVWQADQTINVRGVQVDIETLDAAQDILAQTEKKYTLELARITGGAVGTVSQVANFVTWLNGNGCDMPDLKKETVEAKVKEVEKIDGLSPISSVCLRALKIRQELGAANVKKLRTLKLQVSSDGRLRDQYMYCGADRTGRWSAGGVQLQNITSKGPDSLECGQCGQYFGADSSAESGQPGCPRCHSMDFEKVKEWGIGPMRSAIEDIRTRSLDHLEEMWGSSIPVLCGILRGLFIPKPGHKFICVDFSAIEAVVQACLSRCQWRIDVFSTHGKIYEMSAGKITGTPLETYLEYKKANGVDHSDRKKIGKIAELASGYGGWIKAWINFGADKYYTDGEIKQHILKWRDESPEIVEMWGGQFKWCGPGKWDYRPEFFGLEGMAILAILNPGTTYAYIDISYTVLDNVLVCRLPSGRCLNYHRPRLTDVPDKLDRGPCLQIVFEGYNSNSQKGAIGWLQMETYGGRLFENVVQAVALDIQAEAIVRLEKAGYPVVMHTHDEACAEVPDDPSYSVDAMNQIMSVRPSWCQWWPLKAAGWEDYRYQK